MTIANDSNWTEIADWLQRSKAKVSEIFGPLELSELLPIRSGYQTRRRAAAALIWFVIHKGRLDEIDRDLLADLLLTADPVFANPVFVVYRRRESRPPAWREHVRPLFDRLLNQNEPGADASRPPDCLGADGLMMVTQLAEPAHRSVCERAIRALVTAIPLSPTLTLCRVLGRYKMFVDPTDLTLSPHLMLDGWWEIWITAFLVAELRPGMHVIDLGANLGYYTVLMADLVGANGSVIACEPNPAMFERLAASVALNGFDHRVTLRPEAICDRSGDRLPFAVTLGHPANSRLLSVDRTNYLDPSQCREIDVPTLRLDDLIPAGQPVDLIKIDVEGAERAVWAGMQRVLRDNREILVVLEFNAAREPNWLDFLAEITAAGFPLVQIDGTGELTPLTAEQVASEPQGEDRILILRRPRAGAG